MFHIRKTRAVDCENMSFDVDKLNKAFENVPVIFSPRSKMALFSIPFTKNPPPSSIGCDKTAIRFTSPTERFDMCALS